MQPLDLLKTLEESLDDRLTTVRAISETDSTYMEEIESRIVAMYRG